MRKVNPKPIYMKNKQCNLTSDLTKPKAVDMQYLNRYHCRLIIIIIERDPTPNTMLELVSVWYKKSECAESELH